ncbi:DAK2 domain-containing protein [Paenibacillus beijingensis]|uniref:DhaL domain-containing protein n=1 Tax=Paenibacillus beijingensis TaxID=1126833 RepID=A0A0D5NSJ4_9BACL|nr:DAK2 domain-containing protein [Paenibacillus beijingensis]AJY77878.1 hypothetical protein VN24_20190 [Paenibacillus beijingensis]
MALLGAQNLQRNAERVNALNVFPVPDGDTGTNMNLTMTSGVREMEGKKSESIGKTAEALSKGLLMGARGNSGVILSQLFRGIAKALAGLDEAGTVQFAAALQQGVDTAYKAVVKPVEGTILTVAKEAARHGVQIARRTPDMIEWMREVCGKADEALQRTPDLLPVLKQVGVVDSGGQGLLLIYEGFLQALIAGADPSEDGFTAETGGPEPFAPAADAPVHSGALAASPSAAGGAKSGQPAQAGLSAESIEFLYDMEFFINLSLGGRQAEFFDENAFKKALAKDGDCILVIPDDDVVKVHVHTRRPGDVLNLALPYGELTDLHILNMRQQHRDLTKNSAPVSAAEAGEVIAADYGVSGDDALVVAEVLAGSAMQSAPPETVHELAPFGIIAVASGEGVATIFLDNDTDIVLSGGQTMNPSTEDFVNAIQSLPAEHIYLLPNNGNVILAAEQAAELSERNVTVIPTRNIPQGLSALLAFKESETPQRNAALMSGAAEQVTAGSVTRAVRDTEIDGVQVKEGDYIGILEKSIVVSVPELQSCCQALIDRMMESGGDLLTVLTGEGAAQADTDALAQWVASAHPDVELEVQDGGQPLYPYLLALE